jgi:hypothetical protein
MSGRPVRAPPIPNDAVSARFPAAESALDRAKVSPGERLELSARAAAESLAAADPIADTPGLSASSPAQVGCDALDADVACATTSAGAMNESVTAHFIAVYDFDDRRIDVPRNLGA